MSNLYDNRSKKAEHGGLFVVPAVAAGQEIEIEKTVNAPYESLKLFGKSEQKAKWNQAEGVTTQVQEDGYNLLDCNVEWEPSAENQGISNIQSGVGSISFDYLHDHSNYPYIRTKGTMHLKPGIYTISGIASGDPLDSVGFSQGEPDGYRQVVGDCNGTITIETEGDYRFYVYPMGEDRLASYELTNLMVTEGDTSKTYQEYGYSKPSPAYPSELTSHISAGSYQIPTENGIYEVTLTEDLRGLDDTYRDFIRFDSVSGTGYLQKMCKEIVLDETRDYGIFTAYNRGDYIAFYSLINPDDMIKDTHAICLASDRYQAKGAYWGNGFSGNVIYQYGETSFNSIVLKTDKKLLSSTDAAGLKAWLTENPVTVIYKRKTPVKEALTFTKVESSTLPVFPWTAYGKQLIPFEPYVTNSTGSTTKDWPAPPFVLGETYYFGGGVCDDGTAINSNNSAFIILKDGVQVYNKSPNRAITITEDLLGADTVRLYTNSSLAGKTVTQFTGELGSSYSGSYEPFNPTPPESLTASPDYPQQIYDLKDVMVTSRGRNLFDENILLNQGFIKQSDGSFYTGLAAPVYGKVIWENTEGYTGQLKIMFSGKWNEGATGGGVYPSVYYTDGTTNKIPFGVYGQWVDKYIITASGKTASKIMWDYGTNTTQTWIKNFAVYKNEELGSDVFPPFDKYRCTYATIPLTLRSCGDDKDCLQNDGQAVNLCEYIKEVTIDGTLNNFVCNVVGSASSQACSFFVKYNGTNYERLKAGSTISNTHGFMAVPKSDSGNYLPYITIPWSVLGLTSAPTTAEANEAAKSYCAAQNTIGTPLIMRYVLYTPVETEITDAWAQDLIGLKTAPYYTKLFADKETGGSRALYLSLTENGDETAGDYLLTPDMEKVVTDDGKTVILF